VEKEVRIIQNHFIEVAFN